MTDKISVIIPVHNGAKWLKRISKCVLEQSYKDIELIFIENFSNDNSLEVLKKIAKNDNRVIVIESKIRGTSFARKKGVEYASGKYTVFMDQDDKFVNRSALETMHSVIVNSNSEICQFSYYKQYAFLFNRKIDFSDKQIIISIDDIRKREVASLLEGTGYLARNVWSKIYLTEVLKDAAKLIDVSLFFGEDQFLNICSLTSSALKSICINNSAFYNWNVGTGFSSTPDSGFALFEDYKKTKPRMLKILQSFDSEESVFFRFHVESLYFLRALLISKTECNVSYENCQLINSLNQTNFILLAKEYFNHSVLNTPLTNELKFLSSNYSAEEFCERYRDIGKKENKHRLLI